MNCIKRKFFIVSYLALALLIVFAQQSATVAEGRIIEQDGPSAQSIRKNILPKINLPPGFEISLFAYAPEARHMAVSPKNGLVWIGTREDTVWLATDKNKDGRADRVAQFAPEVDFDLPNGVCLGTEGHLYVAERNRVLFFPYAEKQTNGQAGSPTPIIKQGELIPPSEESRGHSARVCVVGPDDLLYVSLGQPYNISPKEKLELYDKVGIGGIIRFRRFPGKLDREVVAIGIRNSVGHAFSPVDGALWFTDNQVDGMGDETPPGELNKAPSLGPNVWYGFPHYGGGEVRTLPYKNQPIPKKYADNYVPPQVEMTAHAADLGMMFYTGRQFPDKYRNAIFNAQRGSWNATKPRGARVMVTYLDEKGNAAKTEVFADGWLTEYGGYLGRPVDVQQYIDGSILVSDDKAGAIYQIEYTGD